MHNNVFFSMPAALHASGYKNTKRVLALISNDLIRENSSLHQDNLAEHTNTDIN